MNYRSLGRTVLAGSFLLIVAFVYGGPKDFWVTKPFTEWTAQEVEKLLQKKSPWTHVQLMIPSEGGGTSRSRDPNPSYPTPIYINWSSRPIREALVRKAMLENPGAPKDQFDQILNFQSPNLVFYVTGPLMGGGRGGAREEVLADFREKTFLQKKNKEKIPLADVTLPGPRGGNYILQFPREVDGKPVIVAEDKEITLVLRIGEGNYKFVFKFADMMIGDKLEI